MRGSEGAFLRRGKPYLLLAIAVSGCGKAVPPGPSFGESIGSSEIARQRVTATIERHAAELVHVQTERGTLVTTPEHPFAKAGSGWVAARELRPRDRVLSARFGTVGVTSVRTEELTEPVAVFNFTVDRSHAYLVGNDEVLVHNADCEQKLPETIQEKQTLLEKRERELRALQEEIPTSPKERERIEKRIAELNIEIRTTKFAITWQRKREAGAATGREASVSALADAEAELDSITERLAELRRELLLLIGSDFRRPGEITDLKKQIAKLESQETKKELDIQQLREINKLLQQREDLRDAPVASEEERQRIRKELSEKITRLRRLMSKRRYDREDFSTADSKRRRLETKRYRERRAQADAQNALKEGLASADPEVREVLSGELPATEYDGLLQNLENELQNEPSAPVNEPLLEGVVREFLSELEGAQKQLQVELQRDKAAVDDLSEDLLAYLRTPSPEQLPQVRESILQLQDQLAAERAQFEMNYVVLGRQEALLEAVLQQGGSSHAPVNLQSIRERRGWLRDDWQQRMQNRLTEARRQLRDMQSSTALRDEEIEAELAEHISILSDELANPPF